MSEQPTGSAPTCAAPVHGLESPSPWADRWLRALKAGFPAAQDSHQRQQPPSVLDVACGGGRHSTLAFGLGFDVVALDRDQAALAHLPQGIEAVSLDLEVDGEQPLRAWAEATGQRFDAVLVTHYLYRPLLPDLALLLKPAGLLIYETFASGHEHFGRPRRAEFLLQPAELLSLAVHGLRVVAFEEGFRQTPSLARIQRAVLQLASPSDLQTWPALDPDGSA